MSKDLNLAMRISADVTRLMGGLAKGEGGLRKFGNAAKQEMAALGRFAGSVEGRMAQLGLSVSVVAAGLQSARLDKDLKQLQLTAGATAAQADVLRKSWMDAQVATGQGVDELKSGSDALVAAGLSIQEANAAVLPMAETMAVAKTNATALGQAMGVAGKMFNIDLSNTQEASLLLDKMVVAGRLGNAELENLPDIFARVGGNAKAANMNMDQTLALVETLSSFEPNAERLATLTDSTLRVFTNDTYRKAAEKGTGIKFYNADKSARDPIKVIEDMKSKYDKLTTDLDKNNFIAKAFGTADQDTIKGVRNLLSGSSLQDFAGKLDAIKKAAGTIKRDLPDAIGNAIDQTGRLTGALRKAADGFAQPITKAYGALIKHGLDSKKDGGLGLDGVDIVGGGLLGALALGGAARYGGKAIKGLAGKFGGVGVGVATGKALEEAAGVTPVYVVNMPDSLGGAAGLPDALASVGGKALKGKGSWLGKLGLPLMLAASGLEAYNLATTDGLSAREKAAGYGGIAGGAAGGWAGASAGAALGTMVLPGIGTAIGGLAGGALGYWGGSALGQAAGNAYTGQESSLAAQLQNAQAATGPLAKGAVIPGSALAIASQGLSQQLLQTIRGAKPVEVGGKMTIEVVGQVPTKVTQLQSQGPLSWNVLTGATAAGRG